LAGSRVQRRPAAMGGEPTFAGCFDGESAPQADLALGGPRLPGPTPIASSGMYLRKGTVKLADFETKFGNNLTSAPAS
jgi:hypothetical protein